MKHLLSIILFSLSLLFGSSLHANITLVYNTTNHPLNREAKVTKNFSNNYTNELCYKVDSLWVTANSSFEGTQDIELAGFYRNQIPGEPAYLERNDVFFVPDGYSAELEILECKTEEINFNLAPSIIPLPDSYNVSSDDISNINITPYNGYKPAEFVNLGKVETYRGRRIQYVNIYPALYSYDKKKLLVAKELMYRVTLTKSTSISRQSPSQKMNLLQDNTLESICVNTGLCKEISQSDNSREYLIVTTDELLDEVTRFAKWKHIQGNRTKVIHMPSWDKIQLIDSIKVTH